MSRSKDKGRSFEHQVADTLTENGIPARRVPMSGMLRGLGDDLDGDVIITDTNEKIECKFRQNISVQLWDWLSGNDYLAIKRNHKEPLIVLTLEQFIRLKNAVSPKTNSGQ